MICEVYHAYTAAWPPDTVAGLMTLWPAYDTVAGLMSHDTVTGLMIHVLWLGLGGLFPNFHLLCYSHIPENTLYYSLNFPLLFPIIPEELVQLECKNSPTKKLQKKYIKFHSNCTASSQNLQHSPVKHCITRATSALERSILSTILSLWQKLPTR